MVRGCEVVQVIVGRVIKAKIWNPMGVLSGFRGYKSF